ncbi:hypothetical protein FB45DRAFT_787928 [Roridomyces roridus]|uniref:F-box domain-containing protein n=1 Tax=Roridomyces roridus TaxID=1738132 RepID=A0AAD7C5H7_9AGAR|nr:hypothetical protein FB45DRAFT_787928 [Roridomyces roridus]
MSSPDSCNAPCRGAIASPLSPFPELLASNDMPNDVQAAAISSAVEKAQADLIFCPNSVELQAFIQSHTAILAPIRRVPNEILAEFFAYCVDVSEPLDPKKGEAWVVSRVCCRWRAVAIACPELWSHFVFPKEPIKHLQDSIHVQLERAPYPSPLSIRVQGAYEVPRDVMDLLFAAHARWEELVLRNNRDLVKFVRRAHNTQFPRLKKLEINDDLSSRLLDGQDPAATFDIVQSFPALTNLYVDARNELLPTQLDLPWSQLQHCTLWCFLTADVLRILPLLPPCASVVIRAIHDADAPQASQMAVSKVMISTLEFDNCERRLTTTLLAVFRAPSLRKFVFRHNHWSRAAAAPIEVANFLTRSGCALEHWRVEGAPLSDAGVLGILKRGHDTRWMNELIRLDVHRITDKLRELLKALGRETGEGKVLVPNLRTLAVRGSSELEGVDVLGLLKSRNPTLRRLPFERWQWEFPDSESGDGLEARLDVVILEDD